MRRPIAHQLIKVLAWATHQIALLWAFHFAGIISQVVGQKMECRSAQRRPAGELGLQWCRRRRQNKDPDGDVVAVTGVEHPDAPPHSGGQRAQASAMMIEQPAVPLLDRSHCNIGAKNE
jgi:hypothetical protein